MITILIGPEVKDDAYYKLLIAIQYLWDWHKDDAYYKLLIASWYRWDWHKSVSLYLFCFAPNHFLTAGVIYVYLPLLWRFNPAEPVVEKSIIL